MNESSTSLERPRDRRLLIIVLLIAGFALACGLDMPVFRHVHRNPQAWVSKDFAGMLRCGGYLPTWFIVAAAIYLHDSRRAGRLSLDAARRASMLVATVVLAGLFAEVGKLVFRRERGGISGRWYEFRAFADDPIYSSGLSMPSSHAIVAFGAAFVLGRFFPAARPVFMLLAIGTGVYRISTGAHFVSDVYVAAVLAWLAAWLIARAFAPSARGNDVPATAAARRS